MLAPRSVPAIADALRDVAITGLFYSPSFLREPWGGTIPPMPGCVWFHAVTSGRCDVVVDGERYELMSGDLALIPHGAGHRIEAGRPETCPLIPDFPEDDRGVQYAVLHAGGNGPLTELVCGGLRLEHPSARRLLDALPAVVQVRATRRSALEATLSLLAEEARGEAVGSEAVVSRLCDILVIQAIRDFLSSDDAGGSAWLRAMGDPQSGSRSPHSTPRRARRGRSARSRHGPRCPGRPSRPGSESCWGNRSWRT